MKFIKNLKIRNKLLFLLFLLLAPLIYFVAVRINQELTQKKQLDQVQAKLNESEYIAELLHVFQRERALIILASAADATYLAEARTQRQLTNRAEQDLRNFLSQSGRTFPGMVVLDQIRVYRTQLDQGKLNLPEFRQYSLLAINTFLNQMEDNATGVANLEIGQRLSAIRALSDAKVQLGRVRSRLMLAIQQQNFTYQDYAGFYYIVSSHIGNLEQFGQTADDGAIRQLQTVTTSPSYKQLVLIFRDLENNPQMDLRAYNPADVLALFAASLEDFRSLEKQLLERVQEQVRRQTEGTRQSVIVLMVTLLLILGLAVLLSLYIINLISTSLSTLRTAAEQVRIGATNVSIDISSQDEIGEVAEAFKGVVNKNIALTKVAQAIGEGNYEVKVATQGADDVLSHAISEMKDNLSRFTAENNNRNWILSGTAKLNDALTGEVTLANVAENALAFLVAYTSSDAGIIYLNSNTGALEPVAATGVNQRLDQLPVFREGTGKVGQAVKDNKLTVLQSVSDQYLNISTGLAEITPATIVIIPLIYRSEVVGAIELCSRQQYTSLQTNFFNAIAERISVFIYTLRAHTRTQELLYETQNQAEELESQQEELRQANAELKASEEELKVSQEELQEKNAELEEKAQLLEEQYEALGAKNKALEDARQAIELKIQQVETVSKYKSEFLANMSHELRTPLNSILILSRLLADNPENTLTTKQAEHAQIIHRSGADLLKLINEILDLSKIESGMIRLELKETDVKALELRPVFAEMAKSKNIDFSVHYNLNTFQTITTDRFRLEQVLKNLIGNALKFTPEDGKVEVEVYEVENKPRFTSAALTEASQVVAIAVKDTGIGIPKDKQEVIFEAFQQADSSTTRKFGGTGLGLAISRELATLLGGEILLQSEPGKGSTFTLFLPRHATPPDEQDLPVRKAPAAQPALSSGHSRSAEAVGNVFDNLEASSKKEIAVLIIEDDKAFNDILADFAHAKNFTVHQAYTGTEGFKLAKETQPDAVLLDIQLPDISGWEVLRQIRDDKELRHVNVHVMSAYDKQVAEGAQENEEYLPKPVTLEMLNTAFTTISGLSDSSIENILIVEDNENENRAIAELLLAHNIQSVSALSAEEAEQMLAKQKIDCIILDLNLPGMKGSAWMEKIRSQKALADIPIIVYSGKDLSETEEKKLKRFANTIIIKNEYSYLRLLDEVQLFLHKVNQKLPLGNDFRMKLHVPEEILRGKKVLVADDDVRNVYSLSHLLEQQGMQIVAAYDGQEALQKLETEPEIDIVLMDIMMPEMDGIEAIKRLRQNHRFRKLPVIALTAKAMKEDREKCIQAGASDYIPKPVDTDKLLTLMRVWLYEA